MAGPRASPWARLLLAALLIASFSGDMGESAPRAAPLLVGTALARGLPRGFSPRHSLSHLTSPPLHMVRAEEQRARAV